MTAWSQSELDFLCNHYNDMTCDEMADKLGRTRYSIYNKGLDMGIVRKKVKKINQRPIQTNGTICWQCRHATNPQGICPWSKAFKPVPGWDAKPYTIYLSAKYQKQRLESYLVQQCPLFEEG